MMGLITTRIRAETNRDFNSVANHTKHIYGGISVYQKISERTYSLDDPISTKTTVQPLFVFFIAIHLPLSPISSDQDHSITLSRYGQNLHILEDAHTSRNNQTGAEPDSRLG